MEYRNNSALGAPYGRTAAGASYFAPRINPMEEAYRYALRNLEDSFERELSTLHAFMPYGYDDFYRREHEIKSYYYSKRDRLKYDFNRDVQQYYYGYGRSLRDSYYSLQQTQIDILKYNMYPPQTYLLPKETTTMPTETKKYIIISSAGAAEHPTVHKTLADAEKEATRLAKELPKQEFTVYATAKSFKVADKPVDVKVFI